MPTLDHVDKRFEQQEEWKLSMEDVVTRKIQEIHEALKTLNQ
jgi:hypothetical protein